MAKISVVTPTNLGDGIKRNAETKKFDVAVDNQTITLNSVKDLAVNVDALTDDRFIDVRDNKLNINLNNLLWAMISLTSDKTLTNDIPATDFDVDFKNLRALTLKGMTFTSNSIGNYQHLTALRHISGPEVISVSDNAFKDVKLTSINLPKVENIGNYAFRYGALTSVNLPKVKTIGERAFANNKITSVNLPEVETIKNAAFDDNPLDYAYLPKVKTIGLNAFFTNRRELGNVPTTLMHAATPFSAWSQIKGFLRINGATWYVEPEHVQEAKGLVDAFNKQYHAYGADLKVKTFAEFPHPQA